jgi:two-component system, chemotaxis family, CheB/CheR fusion protein
VRRVLRTLSSIERTLDDPVTKARYIVRVLPYRSVDNFIAGVVVTFVDVTALTRAQERHKLLLAELQHRVRNTLAVVRAIARRTGESSTSVDDYAMHLEGRLAAFGRVQAAVTRDPGVGVNLATLVAEELLAHAAHEGEQATISGPPIHLRPKAAETFALAVHELATNAVKYGALSKSDGRVRIGWKINEANGASSLTFHWAESGGPKGNGAPRRRGFGTELLEQTLSYELKAQTSLDFAKDGLTCTIELPLTERVAFEPPQ